MKHYSGFTKIKRNPNTCYDDPTSMLSGVSSMGGGLSLPMLPLIEGGASLISGLVKQNQASKLKQQLDRPDPELQKYMGELDRQRKSFESGSAYGHEMRELKNQESATQSGVIQAAKGNTGSALQAIEQVGLNTGMAYGKIAAQGQERQDRYNEMYGNLVSKMENRKYEENAYEYQQKQADARDSKMKGLQTLLNTAALGGSPKSGAGGGSNITSMLQGLMGGGGGAASKAGGAGLSNPFSSISSMFGTGGASAAGGGAGATAAAGGGAGAAAGGGATAAAGGGATLSSIAPLLLL